MSDWRTNLIRAIRGAGMDMKSASLAAGLNHAAVSQWLGKQKKDPTIENFLEVCEAIGADPSEVLGGKRLIPNIPIVGVVGAGEAWLTIDEHKADPLEFEVGNGDLVGFEVRGDSMDPVYRDRDFLVCHRHAGRSAHNLIGSDCVVRTMDGGQYAKILQRGRQPGLFTLKSYNPRVADLTEQQLDWVARVVWIKRSS